MIPDFMGYDRAITLFSPDGRLLQVEYAKEPVLRGFPVLALKTKDKIIIISYRSKEDIRKNYGSFLILDSVRKIMKVNENTAIAFTGILSDGRVLVERARDLALSYKSIYGRDAPVDFLVKELGDYIQMFTQYGGARPFGVALIICGFKEEKPRIFMIEPSGIFFEYKAICIGKNHDKIMKELEKYYKEDMNEEDAIKAGLKSILSTFDRKKVEKIEADEFEIVVLSKEQYKELSKEEVERYLSEVKKEVLSEEKK